LNRENIIKGERIYSLRGKNALPADAVAFTPYKIIYVTSIPVANIIIDYYLHLLRHYGQTRKEKDYYA